MTKNREQQRRLRELQKLVDKATESDRLYFERYPQRRHRVRLSHRAEIDQNELLGGEPLPVPPGFRWFTVVRNVCPGARLRVFTLNREDAEVDLDEPTCREIYQWLETSFMREVEAKTWACVCGDGGAR
jgi:hypothetical protein